MKKITIIMVVFILFISCGTNNPKMSDNVDTVYYPENVMEIKSATFSTGGGKSRLQYFKVFCLMSDDTYKMFFVTRTGVAGMFGWGRYTIPIQIKYIRQKGLRDKIIYEEEK